MSWQCDSELCLHSHAPACKVIPEEEAKDEDKTMKDMNNKKPQDKKCHAQVLDQMINQSPCNGKIHCDNGQMVHAPYLLHDGADTSQSMH